MSDGDINKSSRVDLPIAGADKSAEPCCGAGPVPLEDESLTGREAWVAGHVTSGERVVPQVATVLTAADRRGSWKVRWRMNRGGYTVPPGLYAVGCPTSESPVLVSANYKMSFDRLRSELSGRDLWILVLNTRGVNVWCSAGKGTFGTAELVSRIRSVGLEAVVTHRKLILPQLSATGVSAHEVKKLSGFRVVFGPVKAADIPEFLDSGLKKTPAMRRVEFPLKDRLVLIPVDVVGSGKYALPAAVGFFVLSGFGPGGYSFARLLADGPLNFLIFLGAWLAGAIVTQVLLPWLPGRSFSAKGGWVGLLYVLAAGHAAWHYTGVLSGWLTVFGWVGIVLAVSAYMAMIFTGSSTYTSLSGVRREMRVAVPIQIALAVVGLGLWIAGLFTRVPI